MKQKTDLTGIVIALAWPQTWCKQPNSWYDRILLTTGINRNHFYMAGHSALVLIRKATGDCYYFDFGRYHAPFNYGRVRSGYTDDDLQIPFKAKLSEDQKTLLNYQEILNFLQHNISCHGNGHLHASYDCVSFEKAMQKACELRAQSPIIYGPFIWGGTNCSRFTHSVIMAGKPKGKNYLKLKYLMPLTPSPVANVNALNYKRIIKDEQNWEMFYPSVPLNRERQYTTLPQPALHPSIPDNAKWIAGEGAGSWFHFMLKNPEDTHLLVTRYSEKGDIECRAYFKNPDDLKLDIQQPFELTYLSHCREINAIQNNKKIKLQRIDKYEQSSDNQVFECLETSGQTN